MGRRTFTRAFKFEAVRSITDRGKTLAAVARELDVHPNVLANWVRDVEQHGTRAFPGRGRSQTTEAEMNRLRRELHRVTVERDILKKAAAFFAREER